MVGVPETAAYFGILVGVIVYRLGRGDIFPALSVVRRAQDHLILFPGDLTDPPACSAVDHVDLQDIYRGDRGDLRRGDVDRGRGRISPDSRAGRDTIEGFGFYQCGGRGVGPDDDGLEVIDLYRAAADRDQQKDQQEQFRPFQTRSSLRSTSITMIFVG